MSRLRIAMVTTTDMAVRVLILENIQALQRAGHEVTAICAPGPFVEELRESGLDVITAPIVREISPWRDLVAARALYRLFRERGFDVVQTQTPKAGLVGPMAARAAGVPMVVHVVFGFLFHDRMPLPRWCAGWLFEKTTAVFAHRLLAQSAEDVAAAPRKWICSASRIGYLGNGIDTLRFHPDRPLREHARRELGYKPDDIVVGAVGRLVYEKGFAELFAAIHQLVPRNPRLRFLIVGPRSEGESDQVRLDEYSSLLTSGAVQLLDWQEDMASIYNALDLFVLPTYREGVPRACMEAAATAVPVIASDIRGCRELVLNNRTGLLVPVRDVGALVAAIESVTHRPQAMREAGARGRQHIDLKFRADLVNQRLVSFYDEIELALGKGATAPA